MNNPSYAVEQLARMLQDVRVGRGFSQRELARRAGLGQNRLALIETGRVDLRTSTLVQLARALDLELVLVPRRMLPAVQSLTGGTAVRRHETGHHSVQGTPIRVLRRIQRHLAALESAHPSSEELAQAKSATHALIEAGSGLGGSNLGPGSKSQADLQALRRSVRWLALARTNKANKAQAEPLLAKAAAQLRALCQMLPATARLGQAPREQRAAYSLEDEIS